MPKGPNSFFIPPDMELVKDGSVYSSNDGTGAYSGTCVAKSTNKGSLFSLMTGSPTSGITLDMQIIDSGSNGTATYAYKKGTSLESGGIDSWYGEPDRRYMWDIHNPLLNDISTVNAASSTNVLENEDIRNSSVLMIKGVYFSVTNKEYLFIRYQNQSNYKIHIYSRDIYNTEQNWTDNGEIDIQSTGNNRGISPTDVPIFDVCEHTDGKLKLIVRSSEDIDMYESTDGSTFTLVCKEIMSRFADFRICLDLKIASSGPYLKIVYGRQGIRLQPNSKAKNPIYLGGFISSDGGATWNSTEIPWGTTEKANVGQMQDVAGDGIEVSLFNASFGFMNLNYDLCGLKDGSGRFVLTACSLSPLTGGVSNTYVSDGPSKFINRKNLYILNSSLIGKIYLGCSNDWIWMIIAGSTNAVSSSWGFMGHRQSSNTPCDTYKVAQAQQPIGGTYKAGDFTRLETKENKIFYLKINDDLKIENWKKLGDDFQYHPSNVLTPDNQNATTGAKGSYFFLPGGGNLYACGPYMGFVSVGNVPSMGYRDLPDGDDDQNTSNFYSYQHQAQYFRLSGWNFRPVYPNLGHWQRAFPFLNEKIFRHQALGVIAQPEFNYIWGKPVESGQQGNTETNSLWGNHEEHQEINMSLREDGLVFHENTIAAADAGYQQSCNFYYFKCPSVLDSGSWTSGLGQTLDPLTNTWKQNAPKFPDTMTVSNQDAAQHSWIGLPSNFYLTNASLGDITNSRTPGCCVVGVFGGVINGSDTKNSIGVRLNSYLYADGVLTTATPGNNFVQMTSFLRMSATKLSLYDISYDNYNDVYRETSTELICEVIPDVGTYGATPFSSHWWEFRLSFFPNYQYNPIPDAKLCSRILLEVRKIGTETWISSGVVLKPLYSTVSGSALRPWKNRPQSETNNRVYFGTQEIAFGLFKDSSGQSDRSVQFRSLKIAQGTELSQIAMKDDQTGSTDYGAYIAALRGRKIASRPAYLENNQSVVWGGIGGFKNDFFSTTINSSFDAKNTIKTSSPRFEYRSLGSNTSDIKSSTANIVYQINTEDRTSNSLDGFGMYHTGVALMNINARTVKVEYSNTSNFVGGYTIGPVTNEVKRGRVTSCSNNNVVIEWDNEAGARHINDSQYTSSGNTEYYLYFKPLSAGVPVSFESTSYKILKQRGSNFNINIPSIDLSDSSYSSNIAGTTVLLFSNQCVIKYGQLPTQNKYMRVTLSGHLGTESYLKLGTMVAGITFGMERVPLSWEHTLNNVGNATEFNSRSGVRWAYQEGPSARTFSGVIPGDVFEEERRNIVNITQQAMQYNVNPVVMIFDGDDSGSISSGDDTNAKTYTNPENILLGTFSPELSLTNPGWRYDETLGEWKTVGDMELTIIEVV